VALLAKPEKAEIQASTFDIPVREPLSLVSEPEGTRLPIIDSRLTLLHAPDRAGQARRKSRCRNPASLLWAPDRHAKPLIPLRSA